VFPRLIVVNVVKHLYLKKIAPRRGKRGAHLKKIAPRRGKNGACFLKSVILNIMGPPCVSSLAKSVNKGRSFSDLKVHMYNVRTMIYIYNLIRNAPLWLSPECTIMAVATVARPVRAPKVALKSVRWVGKGETRRPGGWC
jgi:hypothetical protein